MKYIKISYRILLFIGILSIISCEKVIMEGNPETGPLAIFDEYTTLVKEKYAMLEFKGVDIDALSAQIRSNLSNTTTDEELFQAIGQITLALRDGHSSIDSDASNPESPTISFDIAEGYPIAFNLEETLAPHYINVNVNPSMKTIPGGPSGIKVIWGTLLQDTEIGYIWVPSWNIELEDSEIEQLFIDLKDTKGIIFDLRQNTGGDPSLATKFASYLMNTSTYVGYERFKTGPNPNDFSDSHLTIQPANSSNKYLKPVAVLTDRLVYSASTTFLYSVDPLDQVFTLGQRTGGGSGSVADGFLANGWYWALSTSEFIDTQDRHLDDGVDPDIPVTYNNDDLTKDEFVERAIIELQ